MVVDLNSMLALAMVLAVGALLVHVARVVDDALRDKIRVADSLVDALVDIWQQEQEDISVSPEHLKAAMTSASRFVRGETQEIEDSDARILTSVFGSRASHALVVCFLALAESSVEPKARARWLFRRTLLLSQSEHHFGRRKMMRLLGRCGVPFRFVATVDSISAFEKQLRDCRWAARAELLTVLPEGIERIASGDNT